MLRPILLEGVDDFARIEGSWNELAQSVVTSRYTQTFEWANLGWHKKSASQNDILLCATVWLGERLVAVWPFQRTLLGHVTHIEPLGSGIHEEYSDPLISPDVDARRVCELLYQLIRPMADVLDIHFVQQNGPMQMVLSDAGVLNIAMPYTTYIVERRGADSFDALLKTYSGHFRGRLKQKRKYLQKAGDLRFELLDTIAGREETIKWVVDEKRQWLRRQNKTSSWLAKDEAQSFFSASSPKTGEFGSIGLFRLTLDGKTIAACITTVDRSRIEYLIASFDPQYGRFAPGTMLMEEVVRWGVEHGLDFDMRPVHMDYKVQWANTTIRQTKLRIALTLKGAVVLFPAYLLNSLRRFLRATLSLEQRDVIRRILAWQPKFKVRDMGAVGPVSLNKGREE